MITQFRQRLLEELQRHNYSSETIRLYLQHVARFALHFHRSPDPTRSRRCSPLAELVQEEKLARSSYNHRRAL